MNKVSAAAVAKTVCFFLVFSLFPIGLFAQEMDRSTIPLDLLRPQRGESLRFPTDIVIGELGRGSASESAYNFANEALTAFNLGLHDAPVFAGASPMVIEDLIIEIDNLGRGRRFRIGGGRTEMDGSVSFLVRFIGMEESLTGELFIMQERTGEESAGDRWIFDELILEEIRSLTDIRNNYRFDFSPYERFF